MLLLLYGQLLNTGEALGYDRTERGASIEAGGLHNLCGSLGFGQDAVGAGDAEHVLGVVTGAAENSSERHVVIVEAVLDDVEEDQGRAVEPVAEIRVGDPEAVRARRRWRGMSRRGRGRLSSVR
ncbi:hypothetical protein ACIQH7_09825 [Streptomyces anulatus]|uniref:hypothetical protein n=1 Tax=Streptomyces sp. NPDC088719 TaxID=3365872 RepID=UPI00380A1B29